MARKLSFMLLKSGIEGNKNGASHTGNAVTLIKMPPRWAALTTD